MRKHLAILLAVALLCLPAWSAQGMGGKPGGMGGKPGGIGGGVTVSSGSWSLVQFKYNDDFGGGTGGGTCSTATGICNVTVAAVAANDSLVGFSLPVNGTSITLSSINGETWSACPTSCSAGDAASGWTGMLYVAHATGGETSFNCTLSAAPSHLSCGVVELKWTGSTVAADASGANDNATCTSCAGIALTLSGASDAIVQIGIPVNNFTAITAPYSSNAHFYSGTAEAVSINTTSGTAPTVTQSSTGTAGMAAIALKGS